MIVNLARVYDNITSERGLTWNCLYGDGCILVSTWLLVAQICNHCMGSMGSWRKTPNSANIYYKEKQTCKQLSSSFSTIKIVNIAQCCILYFHPRSLLTIAIIQLVHCCEIGGAIAGERELGGSGYVDL